MAATNAQAHGCEASGPGRVPGPGHVVNTVHAAALLEGLDLFNRGRYWDAHERWEHCWRTDKLDGWKGLIQTAAALVKLQRGHLRGFGLNWAKAERRLTLLPDRWYGFDIAALLTTMRQLHNDPQHAAWPRIQLTEQDGVPPDA